MRLPPFPTSPRLLLLPIVGLLGSCSTPPKPPTIDESTRRPANSAMAVDLQVCRNELANTRLLATESSRLADSAARTLERLTVQATGARTAATSSASMPAAPPLGNSVYTVRFDFASTHVVVPADAAAALIAEARTAPLIVLRGRTDGSADTLTESRVARERAATVRDYLVSAGIDPARIRATYQPVGDRVADNTDPTGRGLNRRVEIEVYRTLPVAVAWPNGSHP
jgi:outer membrane protein OmpA-like peptidoglycan-associated protein